MTFLERLKAELAVFEHLSIEDEAFMNADDDFWFVALKLLLSCCEGHDPAECLPELGQQIRVDYMLATVGSCSAVGVYGLAEDGAQVVVLQTGARPELPWDFFTRWYPLLDDERSL